MNLNAIQPRKRATENQAAAEIARRNLSATGGNLLFKDTRPVIEAVAKGLREAIPVQPVSLAAPAQAPAAIPGNLTVALKAMTDGLAQAATAIRASITTVAPAALPKPAVAPAPAQRSTGNPSSVPIVTETQRLREAEGREQARKAAAATEADRVLVTRGGGRVRVLKTLNASLSDAAVLALNYVTTEWEKAERRPVRIYAADLSRALDLPLEKAQAAFTELVEGHLVINSRDSLGVQRVQPGLGVTG